MGDSFLLDDRTWQRLWDQILSPVERHHIAMSVLRRRLSSDPLEARVSLELARRWGRKCRFLAIVYLIWTVFWGAVGWADPPLAMPMGAAAFGVVAITCCLAFRRYVLVFLERNRMAVG
jgi:hypothetical protein